MARIASSVGNIDVRFVFTIDDDKVVVHRELCGGPEARAFSFGTPHEGRLRSILDAKYHEMKDELARRFVTERALLDQAYAGALAALPTPTSPGITEPASQGDMSCPRPR